MATNESSNPALDLAFDHVQHTGRHLFLTGKAGTGKTTFLRSLRERLPKQMVVTAPTGVAAINAGGVTLHSFFQLPFGPLAGRETEQPHFRFSRDKIAMIRGMDLLVIDEISMVRADLLDAVDGVLRRYRDRRKPFGGVQLLMIGDLQQLSPVVKDNEWELLKDHYDTPYFFGSRALRETDYACIELTRVYRQQDGRFLDLLNQVRDNCLTADALAELNRRHLPDFSPADVEGYITLCTHNAQAQRLNDAKLAALPSPAVRFTADISGSFPELSYPVDPQIELKVGAQVMFAKNDLSAEKLFFNGKIGRVTAIDGASVRVRCPDDPADIAVEPMQWDNVKYAIDPATNRIAETIEGTFRQIPLKLAWAITIHKSQGLTFERAIIDANASFAHGQVYVALSRCKTLEGLVLRTPLRPRSIIADPAVADYIRQTAARRPDADRLETDRLTYQRELLVELFNFRLLRYHLNALLELADLHRGSLLPGLVELFGRLHDTAQTDLVAVGEKFLSQIDRLLTEHADAETHPALRERLQKAAGYFEDQLLHEILEHLAGADLELDNQALRRQLLNLREKAETETRIKLAGIQACADGFDVQRVLAARSAATLDVPPAARGGKKARRKGKTAAAMDTSAAPARPELFEALRAWRAAQAAARGVPAYHFFSQKTLYALAAAAPKTPADLSNIHGIGPKKIAQYGDALLDLVRQHG
ncbi:MAG TPA: HRDC domain-containing protein [Kiritimatiellia bacterium]|nr:HRDC domain-containing protein [Kiritimatiellia bacterium]